MLVESAPGPRSAHLPHPRIATAVAAQPGVISPATLRIYSQGFSLHPERLKRTLTQCSTALPPVSNFWVFETVAVPPRTLNLGQVAHLPKKKNSLRTHAAFKGLITRSSLCSPIRYPLRIALPATKLQLTNYCCADYAAFPAVVLSLGNQHT